MLQKLYLPLSIVLAVTSQLGLANPNPTDRAKAVIENFDAVCIDEACTPTGIYRSSKDWATAEGKEALADLGVQTVVNLMNSTGCDELDPEQKFNCIDNPVSPYHIWSIEEEDFEQALATVHAARADGAVLINCRKGSDRTGILSALLVIEAQVCHKTPSLKELNKVRSFIEQQMDDHGFNNLIYRAWKREVLSWVKRPPEWLCPNQAR